MENRSMPVLNLPGYAFRTEERKGKLYLLDPVRSCYVRATAEEWVRQHFMQFLIQERGVPRALLAVEKEFLYQGMRRRADIVVCSREGRALLMVECKAPSVELDQAVFDQVVRYNRQVEAGYLAVTNGLEHYCFTNEDGAYRFLEDIPRYRALS